MARQVKTQDRSELTRIKLILAAEPIIAERGLEKAPLRLICEAAGQRNNTSIQYHFANRTGLLQAILEYRALQTEPYRRALLDAVKRDGREHDVKSLLRVAFGPDLDTYRREGNANYLKLMTYWFLHLRPQGALHPADLDFAGAPSLRESLTLLSANLPQLTPERFRSRLDLCAMLVINTFTRYDEASDCASEPLDLLSEDALDMAAIALSAPANYRTARR